MTASYNGFKAGDPSAFSPPGLDDSPIPGTEVKLAPGLHKGSIATVLFHVAAQLNARVEPAGEGCWGYAFRPSKNDDNLISCHASGTAFDYNAPNHPNGKKGTWSAAQVKEIRKILAEVDNLVHWGGDGWGAGSTIDSMHFEIAEGVTVMQLDELAARLTAAPEPAPAPPAPPAPAPATPIKYGERSDRVRVLQAFLTSAFHAYNKYAPTGFFGDLTLEGVKEFQFRCGLVVDGIVGPATVAALERFGYRPL
jgi:hypothetical protein